MLVQVATAARRYKSDRNLPLGTPVAGLELRCPHPDLAERLAAAVGDLRSITRAGDLVRQADLVIDDRYVGSIRTPGEPKKSAMRRRYSSKLRISIVSIAIT